MSVPHLLLVDDSEAILSYEVAALSPFYMVTTASDGREALERLREVRPAAVLLDLSMPHMTGDELLARMQADPVLCRIPVIIVSSEVARGQAGRARGARAFLPKPVRAAELQAIVARVLDEERRLSHADDLPVLVLGVGALELGIPLAVVREVLPLPMTQVLPAGPEFLSEIFDYRGTPVAVLDLARWLGQRHSEPIHERKLIVANICERTLALCADRVRDPESFGPHDILSRRAIGGADHAVVIAMVKTPHGPLPVIDPTTVISQEGLDRLCAALIAPPAPEPS
ncbi:MAG: chemotaxis protein CheW [Myxococcota bacterium]|nr:chemotaxis protein CheW [Myxococcota bacterium]